MLSAAVEQSADSIVITDTGGAIIYVNPAFEKFTGYSQAETIGQNPRLLKSGRQEPTIYQELWATITAGEVWHKRLINKKKDGTFYTADTIITPVYDENDEIINYVALERDMTHQLELEEQLRQSQKNGSHWSPGRGRGPRLQQSFDRYQRPYRDVGQQLL